MLELRASNQQEKQEKKKEEEKEAKEEQDQQEEKGPPSNEKEPRTPEPVDELRAISQVILVDSQEIQRKVEALLEAQEEIRRAGIAARLRFEAEVAANEYKERTLAAERLKIQEERKKQQQEQVLQLQRLLQRRTEAFMNEKNAILALTRSLASISSDPTPPSPAPAVSSPPLPPPVAFVFPLL